MFRSLIIASCLFFSNEAFACPMADAAAYKADSEKVAATEGTKISFTISGMTCGSCSEKVIVALKDTSGVILSAVDYQTGKVEIAYDEKKTTKKDLESILTNTGFKIVEQPS